jgi:hypothetical protein
LAHHHLIGENVPTLKRMFIAIGDIKRKCASRERKLTATGPALAHLRLPSGQRVYPESYINALLEGVSGPITLNAVYRFNSVHGKSLIEVARRELLQRTKEREIGGSLTLDDLAWILGVTSSPVTAWCNEGLLPSTKISNKTFVKTSDLLDRCSWIIPVR